MTLNDYQKLAKVTGKILPFGESLQHAVLGICSECGELCELMEGEVLVREDVNKEHLGEELGDLLWYVALVANTCEIDMNTAYELHYLRADENPHSSKLGFVSYEYALLRLVRYGGEIADVVKRYVIYEKPFTVETKETLAKLIAKVISCAFLLGFDFGLKSEQIMTNNVEKLRKRYPELAYSDGAALARADKASE
jgi:NTP pyrophosphatase (non-canonical NTP hydrolase)